MHLDHRHQPALQRWTEYWACFALAH